jgi:hypothetical protein
VNIAPLNCALIVSDMFFPPRGEKGQGFSPSFSPSWTERTSGFEMERTERFDHPASLV